MNSFEEIVSTGSRTYKETVEYSKSSEDSS